MDSWWYVELGANVRVSMVFILHYSFMTLEGFNILVGKCLLLKRLFGLLLFGLLLSSISIVYLGYNALPVHSRVLFKLLLLVYKALNGMAPLYITELLSYRTCSRTLH